MHKSLMFNHNDVGKSQRVYTINIVALLNTHPKSLPHLRVRKITHHCNAIAYKLTILEKHDPRTAYM